MISQEQFVASISKTLAAGSSFNYPRKPQDRIVFLGALSIFLARQASYGEADLNATIAGWLGSFDATTTLDHVTLRRYLVDIGYLRRDEAGLRYSIDTAALASDFEAPVLALDVHATVANARAEREARKLARRQNGDMS